MGQMAVDSVGGSVTGGVPLPGTLHGQTHIASLFCNNDNLLCGVLIILACCVDTV